MIHKPLVSWSAGVSIALACAVAASAATAPATLTREQLLPKTQELYHTKSMSRSHQGEDKKIVDHGVVIHYMNKEEREGARVVIVNGALYTPKGQPVPYGTGHDKLNYVMDAAGNFYIFDQTGHPELRHSSFFDGLPVACAGDLEVRNGTIVKINSNSGHYSPSRQMFQNVLTELKKDGVALTSNGISIARLSARSGQIQPEGRAVSGQSSESAANWPRPRGAMPFRSSGSGRLGGPSHRSMQVPVGLETHPELGRRLQETSEAGARYQP